MIELNLLPTVKLDYLKAQRSRSLVISVAGLVSVLAVALLLILFSVSALQKKHINDLTKDIKSGTAELQKKPQVERVLTVQNQLDKLT